MKKRLFSIIMTLVMCLPLLPTALAVDTEPEPPTYAQLSDTSSNGTAISVDITCTTDQQTHHKVQYLLIKDSYTLSDVAWDEEKGKWYCDITVSAASYISSYSRSNGKHVLADGQPESSSVRFWYTAGQTNPWRTSDGYSGTQRRLSFDVVEVVPVTGVTLNKTALILTADAEETLTATVEPADATNQTVIWSSSNENIATVDATGKVTAVGVGTARIIAKAEGKTAACEVIVNPIPRIISISGQADSPIQVTLEGVTIDPIGTNGNIMYAVNTKDEVPVDGWQDSEVFTGLNADTDYYFFAKVAADGNYAEAVSESCKITTPAKTVSRMEIVSQPDKLIYTTGDKLDLSGLKIKAYYNDGTDEALDTSKLTMEPANDTILTVSENNGKPVTIIYGGQSCKTDNLTVARGTQAKLSVSGVPEIIYEGDSFTLKTEGGSGSGEVIWSVVSGNATIDENGTISVIGAGEVKVKVIKTADTEYTEAEATVIFHVIKKDTPCDGGDSCPSHAFSDLNTSKWYHEYTDYVIRNNLMKGIGDELFEPNGILSRAMLTQIIYNMEGKPVACDKSTFTDVGDNAWYADAINWASEKEIVFGYGNGEFSPNKPVIRQEMASILCRYAVYKGDDVSARSNMSQYIDKNQISLYAIDAMSWTNAEGLIVGTATDTLCPKDNATRAQVATVITKFCKNIVK